MARARICDRCGKTMKDKDEYYIIGFKKRSVRDAGVYCCPELTRELCSDCVTKFEDFMKMYI